MAELSPFSHQVGGHTCILLVDDRTVCKPWRASEVRFYESAPEELRGFIARYNGVMRVRFGAAPDGTLSFTVAEPDGMSRSTVKAETVVGGQREWSVECQAKLRSKFGDDGVMKYILLENMVCHLRRPCLFDVKVGKRLYGDDDSERKRRLLTDRALSTTSATLGLRASGMQVFRRDRYVTLDKYHGRTLNDATFFAALGDFFSDGQRTRLDVVTAILERLERLRDAIASLSGFRFHSASLLFIYDGDGGEEARADVKMIDFAKTAMPLASPVAYTGADDGYLFGMDTLIRLLRQML